LKKSVIPTCPPALAEKESEGLKKRKGQKQTTEKEKNEWGKR